MTHLWLACLVMERRRKKVQNNNNSNNNNNNNNSNVHWTSRWMFQGNELLQKFNLSFFSIRCCIGRLFLPWWHFRCRISGLIESLEENLKHTFCFLVMTIWILINHGTHCQLFPLNSFLVLLFARCRFETEIYTKECFTDVGKLNLLMVI